LDAFRSETEAIADEPVNLKRSTPIFEKEELKSTKDKNEQVKFTLEERIFKKDILVYKTSLTLLTACGLPYNSVNKEKKNAQTVFELDQTASIKTSGLIHQNNRKFRTISRPSRQNETTGPLHGSSLPPSSSQLCEIQKY